MREKNYVTVLDPFQHKYGPRFGAVLILPHLVSDLMWCASVLASLGATVQVVAGFSKVWSIIISAAISAAYTFIGGLFSVAYTDVIQLACMFIGMWLSVPFMLTNPAVGDIVDNSSRWVGKVDKVQSGLWIDLFLQFMLSAISVQEYWQRALACRSYKVSVTATLIAAFATASFCVPPILVGAAVATTDWNLTSLVDANATDFSPTLALPYALQYLTPPAVSIIGIGALTAAVMSSSDSVILASSTLFARNIYKHLIRPKASEKELKWVLRVTMVAVAVISSTLAIFSDSIYVFVIWASDLLYIIFFPQFVAVLMLENVVNTYGAALGYITGLLLRLLAGEPAVSLPAVIKYPLYSEKDGQLFPFRTFSMVCSLVTIIAVSYLVKILFQGVLPLSWDFLHCFDGKQNQVAMGKVDSHMAASRDNKAMETSRDTKAMEMEDAGVETKF